MEVRCMIFGHDHADRNKDITVKFLSMEAINYNVVNIRQLHKERYHYIEVAEAIVNFYNETHFSERTMAKQLGISKSEIHRLLKLGSLPASLKNAAKTYDTEKYVLLDWFALPEGTIKNVLRTDIISGKLTNRKKLREFVAKGITQ